MRFICQHPCFGSPASFAFLSADLLYTRTFRCYLTSFHVLDFIEQETSSDKSIETLLARGLALDLQSGRTMKQHNARRHFVDILPSVPAGSYEALLEVRLAHAQIGHASLQLLLLFEADGECGHAESLQDRSGSFKDLFGATVGQPFEAAGWGRFRTPRRKIQKFCRSWRMRFIGRYAGAACHELLFAGESKSVKFETACPAMPQQ